MYSYLGFFQIVKVWNKEQLVYEFQKANSQNTTENRRISVPTWN